MTSDSGEEECVSVAELKRRMVSELGELTEVIYRRFSEKTTIKRSDGTLEYRTTLDPTQLILPKDSLPYWNPAIITAYQYYILMFLARRSSDGKVSATINDGKPSSIAKAKKRVIQGPTGAARKLEMIYHHPKPVAQFPRCVSMNWSGMNPILKGCVDLVFRYYLNDFDDECGPVITVLFTVSPVKPIKKQSLMKDERIREQRTSQDLIKEVEEFQQCDPIICGVPSSNLVFVGWIEKSPVIAGQMECEWCMNLWNGLYAHPFEISSGDHVSFDMLIEMVMQFITQLFRRMDKLLSAEIQARLRVHAWRNSPLYLRYQNNEFLKMVTLGKGALRMTSLSVRSPLECELSLRLIQDGLLKYTAHVRVSPVFDFSSQL